MLGPRVDNNERTPIYTEIEKLIDKKMETVPMVKMQTYIPTIKKTTPAFLTIFRTPEGTPNPVTAIREALAIDEALSNAVKQIAYIRIYLDSTAYGVFHYEEDNASALKTYMSVTHNPLSLALQKLQDNPTAGAAKITPQSYAALLTAVPVDAILKALELKPDFTPDSSGGSKKQQKSPSPAAGEGNKKKRNRKNKNENNKTTITTVVTKKQQNTTGEKKKQTPPKGKKAKGGK